MTIIDKRKVSAGKMLVVDLDGADGNAFYLIGLARRLCAEMGSDPVPIVAEMTNGDYEHLVGAFDRHFGEHVDLYRTSPEETA